MGTRRSFETPARDELSTPDAAAAILRIAASNCVFVFVGLLLAAAWIVGQAEQSRATISLSCNTEAIIFVLIVIMER